MLFLRNGIHQGAATLNQEHKEACRGAGTWVPGVFSAQQPDTGILWSLRHVRFQLLCQIRKISAGLSPIMPQDGTQEVSRAELWPLESSSLHMEFVPCGLHYPS